MPTITVDNHPVEPIVDPVSGMAGDDVAARRRMLFERFEQSKEASSHTIDLEAETRQPEAPQEQLDSVILQTPIGKLVFGPPSGVSLTFRIASLMGESNPNRITSAMLRLLMSVRSIDGAHVSPIQNMVEATALANRLTDPVIDYLYDVQGEYFPPPRRSELQVLRKNKRVI